MGGTFDCLKIRRGLRGDYIKEKKAWKVLVSKKTLYLRQDGTSQRKPYILDNIEPRGGYSHTTSVQYIVHIRDEICDWIFVARSRLASGTSLVT